MPTEQEIGGLDTLFAHYVAGTLADPVNALIETHVELSPANHRWIRDLEVIGGEFMSDLTPDSSKYDGMLDAILESKDLDEHEPVGHTALPSEGRKNGLPTPIERYLGTSIDDIKWRTLLPGLRDYRVSDPSGCEATMFWIRPGMAMPTHTHEGSEITLVLKGGFSDITGHYVRGDIAFADEDVDHRPITDDDEDCYCFSVTTGSLRLTGPVGRLVSPFVRF